MTDKTHTQDLNPNAQLRDKVIRVYLANKSQGRDKNRFKNTSRMLECIFAAKETKTNW